MRKFLIAIFTSLAICTVLHAQDPAPCGPFDPGCNEGPPEDEGPAIPVDGGVIFLLAAGATWGIKKLKEKN